MVGFTTKKATLEGRTTKLAIVTVLDCKHPQNPATEGRGGMKKND